MHPVSISQLNHNNQARRGLPPIDYDAPDYSVDPRDPRWRATVRYGLGKTQWYQQRCSPEQQSAIGLHLLVWQMHVGSIFEDALIRGAERFARCLIPGSEEHVFLMIEIAEEKAHQIMFNRFIKVSGYEGALEPPRLDLERIMQKGEDDPALYLASVLCGEIPMDVEQKALLKESPTTHPLLCAIIRQHLADEGPHISYGQEMLRRMADKQSQDQKELLKRHLPLLLTKMIQTMFGVPDCISRAHGIPSEVVAQANAALWGYAPLLTSRIYGLACSLDLSGSEAWGRMGLVSAK